MSRDYTIKINFPESWTYDECNEWLRIKGLESIGASATPNGGGWTFTIRIND